MAITASPNKTTYFDTPEALRNLGYYLLEVPLKLYVHGLYIPMAGDPKRNTFDLFIRRGGLWDTATSSVPAMDGGGGA